MAVKQDYTETSKYFDVITGETYKGEKIEWQASVCLVNSGGYHDVDCVELSHYYAEDKTCNICFREEELPKVIELLQAVQTEITNWKNAKD